MSAKHRATPEDKGTPVYSPTQTPMRAAVSSCGLVLNRESKKSQRITLLDSGAVVYDGCDLYVFDFLKSEYGLTDIAKSGT